MCGGAANASNQSSLRLNMKPLERCAKHPFSIRKGVALYPSRDVRTREALLKAADLALLQAKREGGGKLCVFQQKGFIYSPGADGRAQ